MIFLIKRLFYSILEWLFENSIRNWRTFQSLYKLLKKKLGKFSILKPSKLVKSRFKYIWFVLRWFIAISHEVLIKINMLINHLNTNHFLATWVEFRGPDDVLKFQVSFKWKISFKVDTKVQFSHLSSYETIVFSL